MLTRKGTMKEMKNYFKTPGASLAGRDKESFDDIKRQVKMCTNELLRAPEVEANKECVEMLVAETNPKVVTQIIFYIQRAFHKGTRTAVLSLYLLRDLMQRGDPRFYAAIGSETFMAEMARLARKHNGKTGFDSVECAELSLDLIQIWAESFKGKERLYPSFSRYYYDLRKDGLPFKAVDPSKLLNTGGDQIVRGGAGGAVPPGSPGNGSGGGAGAGFNSSNYNDTAAQQQQQQQQQQSLSRAASVRMNTNNLNNMNSNGNNGGIRSEFEADYSNGSSFRGGTAQNINDFNYNRSTASADEELRIAMAESLALEEKNRRLRQEEQDMLQTAINTSVAVSSSDSPTSAMVQNNRPFGGSGDYVVERTVTTTTSYNGATGAQTTATSSRPDLSPSSINATVTEITQCHLFLREMIRSSINVRDLRNNEIAEEFLGKLKALTPKLAEIISNRETSEEVEKWLQLNDSARETLYLFEDAKSEAITLAQAKSALNNQGETPRYGLAGGAARGGPPPPPPPAQPSSSYGQSRVNLGGGTGQPSSTAALVAAGEQRNAAYGPNTMTGRSSSTYLYGANNTMSDAQYNDTYVNPNLDAYSGTPAPSRPSHEIYSNSNNNAFSSSNAQNGSLRRHSSGYVEPSRGGSFFEGDPNRMRTASESGAAAASYGQSGSVNQSGMYPPGRMSMSAAAMRLPSSYNLDTRSISSNNSLSGYPDPQQQQQQQQPSSLTRRMSGLGDSYQFVPPPAGPMNTPSHYGHHPANNHARGQDVGVNPHQRMIVPNNYGATPTQAQIRSGQAAQQKASSPGAGASSSSSVTLGKTYSQNSFAANGVAGGSSVNNNMPAIPLHPDPLHGANLRAPSSSQVSGGGSMPSRRQSTGYYVSSSETTMSSSSAPVSPRSEKRGIFSSSSAAINALAGPNTVPNSPDLYNSRSMYANSRSFSDQVQGGNSSTLNEFSRPDLFNSAGSSVPSSGAPSSNNVNPDAFSPPRPSDGKATAYEYSVTTKTHGHNYNRQSAFAVTTATASTEATTLSNASGGGTSHPPPLPSSNNPFDFY